jgi:hypothetical protein
MLRNKFYKINKNALSSLENKVYEHFYKELQIMCDFLDVPTDDIPQLGYKSKTYFIAMLNDSINSKLTVDHSGISIIPEIIINDDQIVKLHALKLISKLCRILGKAFVTLTTATKLLGISLTKNFDEFNDPCEKIFIDFEAETFYRHKFAKQFLEKKIRSEILFYLHIKINHDMFNPILYYLRGENFRIDVLENIQSNQTLNNNKIWSETSQRLKNVQEKTDQAFRSKYSNHYIKSVEDAICLVPHEYISERIKLHLHKTSTTTKYNLAKTIPRRNLNLTIDGMDSNSQVTERKIEDTTTRLINFFGGSGQERIDLRKWYTSFNSREYGNVIVIQGDKELPNIIPAAEEIEDCEVIELDFNCDSIMKKTDILFDVEWALSIITQNCPVIDQMSIYSIHYDKILNECFHSYITNILKELDFFESDNTRISNKAPQIYKFAVHRLNLNHDMSVLATRLFIHFDLFNGRSLQGFNSKLSTNSTTEQITSHNEFNVRYITSEIMTHLLQYSLSISYIHMIDMLRLLIMNHQTISFNMAIIFGYVMRSIICQASIEGNVYADFFNLWKDIVLKLDYSNRLEVSSTRNVICYNCDQVHILNLHLTFNTLIPFPWKSKLSYTPNNSTKMEDNLTSYEYFIQHQTNNNSTLQMLCYSTECLIQQNCQNSEIVLCCIFAHCTVLKYWLKCFPCQLVLQLKAYKIYLKFTILQTEFIRLTVTLLQYSFLHMIDNCYLCTVRLFCGLVSYLREWLTNYLVTRTLAISENWKDCNKVFKSVFELLQTFRTPFQELILSLQTQVSPYINDLLSEYNVQQETEGYKSVQSAFNSLQQLVHNKDL